MAIIKKSELNKMDKKSLETKLTDLKKELIRINAQVSMGTLPENPGRIKEVRKTISRITFLLANKKFELTKKEENKKV